MLHEVDMVLLMTVNPGFGGQKSIPYIIEKITELHNRIIKENLNMDIQVDEGISEKNIEQVMKAGANIFVAGSAIFGQDVEKNTSIFLQKIKRLPKLCAAIPFNCLFFLVVIGERYVVEHVLHVVVILQNVQHALEFSQILSF